MHNPNRKRLEIAFRRWIQGTSPSRAMAQHLRETDRQAYADKLGTAGEIDHVIPLCLFDLSDPNAIRLAWSLDNVRRLPAKDNKARGACIASAYLTLLSTEPVDPTEHAALLAKVEPAFKATYPRITLHVEQSG